MTEVSEAEDATEEVEDDDVGYHTRTRVPRGPGKRSIWEVTSIVDVAVVVASSSSAVLIHIAVVIVVAAVP